jgi:hypothetical protein
MRSVSFTLPAHARAARCELESALAGARWPWNSRLSLWIDALVLLLEEEDP